MKIRSYLHEYEVNYVSDFTFLKELGAISGKLAIIDRKVFNLYTEVLSNAFDNDSIMLIDALEETKTVENALEICNKATEINAKRNLKIIAIGGGIIQDIAAFASNILYRGVGLILVPTTLLAQGDSCIGSKSSLNYLSYKNLLGTIYPPEKVYICPQFLGTLSKLDFHSGLGEVVRFRIMDSLNNIDDINMNMDKLLSGDSETVQRFIQSAHAYKKNMVELDEFDLKERRIFNYGHTFGHAIESFTNYAIPHGLAVVLGMVIANKISVMRDILDSATASSIEEICKQLYIAEPLMIDDIEAYVSLLKKDKKREGSGIAAVLMSSGGVCNVVQDVKPEEVALAVKYPEDFYGA